MGGKSGKTEFRDFFRFTDRDGKMKSGTVVYSFSFALLYLIVYGAAYYFLVDVLAPLSGKMPAAAVNLIGAAVPALIAAVILTLPLIFFRSLRRPAFLGYIWLAVFAVFFMTAMCFQLRGDREALRIFLRLFISMVPAPLLLGGGAALLLCKKQNKNEDF